MEGEQDVHVREFIPQQWEVVPYEFVDFAALYALFLSELSLPVADKQAEKS